MGRHILTKLGITYHRQHGDKHPIPGHIRAWLHADPIPKNMHPEYKERRKARVASLIKAYGDTTGVTFVDAAEYQDGHRFAAATTQGGSLRHAASIVTQNAETAEEVAIALAALDPDCDTIDKLEVQLESITPGQNIVIIDDLLATGGSMQAAVNLIEGAGANVALCIVIVEIEELRGRQKLDVPVFSLIPFSAAVKK
ncbi:hypothetical protein HPB52_004276 [Rhipicephalus sanguineus]|uniref:adenine phosphoribosyltransferase n=1 Tax=Rhipicephalus sanguineus TaxID=34632 RepID=A0A9D4QGE3_RHISA|nr:hypothetical protein HPB52_004276 [Rhipicephalus sanguineus]